LSYPGGDGKIAGANRATHSFDVNVSALSCLRGCQQLLARGRGADRIGEVRAQARGELFQCRVIEHTRERTSELVDQLLRGSRR
jgi:hypothetical protein